MLYFGLNMVESCQRRKRAYWNSGMDETLPTMTRSYPYNRIPDVRARQYADILGDCLTEARRDLFSLASEGEGRDEVLSSCSTLNFDLFSASFIIWLIP